MAKKKSKSEGDARQRVPITHEVLDYTPVAIPLRFSGESRFNETIRQIIRSEELAKLAEEHGDETFEEANDFNVGDDYDPTSPYEENYDPVDEEAIRRLTSQSLETSISERLEKLETMLGRKKDGDTDTNERRMEHGNDRPRGRNKIGKGKSKPKQDADDERSVQQTDSSDTRSDE